MVYQKSVRRLKRSKTLPVLCDNHADEIGLGRPPWSSATNVKTASVTFTLSSPSRERRQASTLKRIEVRPTESRLAKTETSSPTWTGIKKLTLSIETVAQRPRASRPAALPAARSICERSQPPKMSPAGLVSDGIAIVRIAASVEGNGPPGSVFFCVVMTSKTPA
jgi:hypothetical protein